MLLLTTDTGLGHRRHECKGEREFQDTASTAEEAIADPSTAPVKIRDYESRNKAKASLRLLIQAMGIQL